MKPSERPLLKCDEHGKKPWYGHIVCETCNRVYQTQDESASFYAQIDCLCGARLIEAEGDHAYGLFSARSICRDCFTYSTSDRPNLPSKATWNLVDEPLTWWPTGAKVRGRRRWIAKMGPMELAAILGNGLSFRVFWRCWLGSLIEQKGIEAVACNLPDALRLMARKLEELRDWAHDQRSWIPNR